MTASALFTEIKRNRMVYILMIPGLVWYIIFSYLPMGGLMLAFKEYKANLGILGSPWVGFDNYIRLFKDPAFYRSIWKTIYINLGRMIFQFPAPIIMALLLNEFKPIRYKKFLQTVFTFPHFLSWVIIAGLVTNFFSISGFLNQIVLFFGGTEINFLGNSKVFIPLLYFVDDWKYAGYGSIIYLAAISGIDQGLYEAAEIDGAGRLQRLLHITLPGISTTIAIMTILTTGALLSLGFDQIFNMANPIVRDSVEVFDIYIYRITFLQTPDFSFSTAVSLLRSLVNMFLLLGANKISRLLGGGGLVGSGGVE
jgi:putative aldouronate transport system permease protein